MTEMGRHIGHQYCSLIIDLQIIRAADAIVHHPEALYDLTMKHCHCSGERPQRARQLWRWMYYDGNWVRSLDDTADAQDGLSASFRCPWLHTPGFLCLYVKAAKNVPLIGLASSKRGPVDLGQRTWYISLHP